MDTGIQAAKRIGDAGLAGSNGDRSPYSLRHPGEGRDPVFTKTSMLDPGVRRDDS
ncbi:MAG: hypothetical protein KA144_06600 [Xanthomonadaceae bacterium]|nr:hypothetical protein [Xanthomonadaceae bacterium]